MSDDEDYPCMCPDSYTDNGVAIEYCLRHGDAAKLRAEVAQLRDGNANLIRNAEILADEVIHANAALAAAEARGRQQGTTDLNPADEAIVESALNAHFHGPGYVAPGHHEPASDCAPCGEAADVALMALSPVLTARVRQQMIDALRDRERFAFWWDVQPWAERPEDAWPTEDQCKTVADYLAALAGSLDGEQTTRKPLLRPSMPPRDPHATGCFGHDHDGEQTTERSVIVRDQHLGKVIKDEEDI